MTDTDIRSRVDELLAQMTPAEKAGQLTQYFYFGFEPDPDAVPAGEDEPSRAASRRRWRRRWHAARWGRCSSRPTRRRSTGCNG